MFESLKISTARRGLLFILLFLLVTDLSILLDISVYRQVLAFAFFTFIPGLLILYIFKLHRLGLTEKVVLSVGLSISFLMFAGLFINWVYPLLGYDAPLSRNSLLISFSIIVLVLATTAYFKNRGMPFPDLSELRCDAKQKAFLVLPALFPILSIAGMHIMNTSDNNIMVMALLFLIPAYAIFIAIKHKQVPEKVYPPMIFFISISLVFLLGLRGNHIIGADAHTEYYLFQQTMQNGHWQIFLNSTLDSCLSISILPTIYQSFLAIDPEYLFKILYPLLFSISPLVVYIIARKYLHSPWAFLATLFFMSQARFLAVDLNMRNLIAFLFFGLSIMILFHPGFARMDKKMLLFVIFAASCIVSHYSTSYIFLFVLVGTWFGMQVMRSIPGHGNVVNSGRFSPGNNSTTRFLDTKVPSSSHYIRSFLNIGIVVLFFAILFFWYSQVTGVAFSHGVRFIGSTLKSLHEFFVLEARGGGTAGAFGTGIGGKEIPQQVEFVFSWLTIALIAIGVLTVLFKNRHMLSLLSGRGKDAPGFLSQKLDPEFFVLSIVCSAILAVSVALPHVFVGYSMGRAYTQMMIVLSPFFVIGGITCATFVRNRGAYVIVLLVLIPYFMCNTSTMYQVFGVPRSMALNSEGQTYNVRFVHEEESVAAEWISENRADNTLIYSDKFTHSMLLSQGMIPPRASSSPLVEQLECDKPLKDGYIYLRYRAVVQETLYDRDSQPHSLAEYRNQFLRRNMVYRNGGSEIWK
ncbi:MAG: DUF2206 domain-containing protein [Chloroflexota bacterium]